MKTPPKVDPSELPTLAELHRATVGAVLLAGVLLVTVVLPAEKGVDPTGVGSLLGLTALGTMKAEAHGEDAAAAEAAPSAKASPRPRVIAPRKDELAVELQPGQSSEIKAVMREGDVMVYSWAADRGELYFDFHGEPEGAAANVFTSFEKATKASAEGKFEAPFTGTHGWYWKNKTDAPITVVLKTSGVYESLSRR